MYTYLPIYPHIGQILWIPKCRVGANIAQVHNTTDRFNNPIVRVKVRRLPKR